MSLWNKQLLASTNPLQSSSNRSTGDLFDFSLKFLEQIPIGIVKQNLATLLWNNFLRGRVVTLTQIIEKVGKIPKDRIFYKELRLAEKDLTEFLSKLSKNFFNTFIESIYSRLSEIPIFNVDNVWQNFNGNESTRSLGSNKSTRKTSRQLSLLFDFQNRFQRSSIFIHQHRPANRATRQVLYWNW